VADTERERSDNRSGDGRSCALNWVTKGEGNGSVGERSVGAVGGDEFRSAEDVLADKRLVHSGERVNIAHHTRGAVDNGEMVAEKCLGPAADLVDLAIVFEDLFHCATVTVPIKVRAPKAFAALADRPTTGSSFADEGMIMVLAVIATAGAKTDRSETDSSRGRRDCRRPL
jgi:hypothetical protein